jgi:hypothetical protein
LTLPTLREKPTIPKLRRRSISLRHRLSYRVDPNHRGATLVIDLKSLVKNWFLIEFCEQISIQI